MSIVLHFFPNGEFTQGVDTSRRRKERAKQEKYEPLAQECRDRYLQWRSQNADIDLCVPGQSYLDRDAKKLWVYTGIDENGNHIYDVINSEGENTLGVQMNYPIGRLIGDGSLMPLVHQSVESCASVAGEASRRSPEKPSRKKLEGMTKNMGRNIRNAAYLLEQRYGKDCISFLTLTLPNLSQEDLGKCCERWDEMVHQFLIILRKKLQKLNIQFEYVYCTEIQPKRLEIRNEYVPHLHLLFRGRNGKKHPWAVTPKQVRKSWASIVSNVLGHAEFVTTALENLQRVRKSATRYLSKYLSKGRCVLPGDGGECVRQQLRTQWGGMARVLSRLIKSCTSRIHSAHDPRRLGVRILKHMEGAIEQGLVLYYKQGEIVLDKCPVSGMERVLKVGSGCLSSATYTGGLAKLLEYVERVSSCPEDDLVERQMVERKNDGAWDKLINKCNNSLTGQD